MPKGQAQGRTEAGTEQTVVSNYMARREKKKLANQQPDKAEAKRPYKQKRTLLSILQKRYPDYQPVVEMADAAMQLTAVLDEARKKAAEQNKQCRDTQLMLDVVTAHEKVAKYVTPQLKAVDLTSNGEQVHFAFQINLA